MNRLARLEHDLVTRLASVGIDFVALYVEEVNRATAQDRFLEFEEFYDEVSARLLEALTNRSPSKEEDMRRFRSEQSDVWDALESYRLTYGMDGRPPRLRGGGFSCMS